MKNPLYFDYHSSYHPFKEVSEILKKSVPPHSFSSFFQNKEMISNIDYQWDEIYRLFGAPNEASLNLVTDLTTTLEQMAWDHYQESIFHSGKQQILILMQKPSLKECWDSLKPFGVVTRELMTDPKGLVTPELLEGAINLRTSLVSIPWANPLTGVIQPIEALAKVCKEKNVAFHVDMSDVIGKKYFCVKDIAADYLTFEAKAFHGPCDIAGCFKIDANKKSTRTWRGSPLYLQALREALYQASERIDDMHLEIARLRRFFEKKLLEKIPGLTLLCSEVERLPQVSLFAFPKVMNKTFLYFLSQEKIYPSLGEKNLTALEELLKKMKFTSIQALTSLSFSLSYLTTQEEIEEALVRIIKQYENVKKFSSDLFREGC